MVRFYACAFNDVGVDGALREKFDAFELSCFFFENSDELRADDLSLCFGVVNARELVKKTVNGVHINEVGVHFFFENADDLLGFTFAEQSVIDVNANELFSDGFDKERGDDGGVNAARKREQHFFVSYLFAEKRHLFFYERIGKFFGFYSFH